MNDFDLPPPIIGVQPKKSRSRLTIRDNGPHLVDLHVGQRLRLARLMMHQTQQWLGAQVKLTFQQIQKYERGSNRISCSMLAEFSKALERPVEWFFEDLEVALLDTELSPAAAEAQRQASEIAGYFADISNERTRVHIVGLVRAIAVSGSGTEYSNDDKD